MEFDHTDMWCDDAIDKCNLLCTVMLLHLHFDVCISLNFLVACRNYNEITER